MKSTLKKIGSLLAIGLLTLSARAAVLVQDNFDEYAQGPLTNQTAIWVAHSGTAPINVVADHTGASANALEVSQNLAQDVHADLDTNKTYADVTITNTAYVTNGVIVTTNFTYEYAFSPTNSVSTLYSSYSIYVTTVPPGPSETYFGHFYVNSSTFKGKLFLVTNGVATPGTFRVAIQNSGAALTNTIPVDLSTNTLYTIVTRCVLGTGTYTVWLNPVNESSGNNAGPLDAPSTGNILAYAFRQASTGEGILDVDNFLVGTRFADVVPGSVNPPTIITQPQDTNVFSGASATFGTLAVGDDTLGYQWYSVTNSVTNSLAGATGKTLTLTALTTNQAGYIFCVVTNGAGTNSTRLAQLTVSAQPIPPIIDTNISPVISTKTIGDTVAFTVAAHGLPAPAYHWKFVPATNTTVTNLVAASNASGTNTVTLTLTNLSVNQSGSYFVTITNNAGYLTTNSAMALLTVVSPPVVSIAALRGMVDPVTYAPTNTTALFTTTGIVTTWTNMSTGGCEFFIQDDSGGICVYWSGAALSNLPPFGAQVQVTGALSAFNNLLELEAFYDNPVEAVVVISTNNQPVAHPLPFDPNVVNSLATMQKLESSYFVASNVTLAAGSTFVSIAAGEPITANASNTASYTSTAMPAVYFTNAAGETFVIYFNAHTDIPGQAKPSGSVTIYGVMGNFKNTFEFTPSRYADIISYLHMTNVLTHARKGDLAVNTYAELVLRPGETLNTHVSVGDAAGGIVTIVPITNGLSTNSSWSGIASGLNATGDFSFSPTSADAGSNYLVNLSVTSTAGTAYTNSISVYVPTAAEQQVAITEFLANPTTNPAAAYYNPLMRGSTVNGVSTNDQYIEMANQSVTDLSGSSSGSFTLDTGIASQQVFRSLDGFGASLLSSNSLVAYGGNGNPSSPPGLSTPVAVSRGLFLPTTGSGEMVLRNSTGNIIDRVVYSASDLSTNGSLSRFPTINDAFVPQAYISTNLTTAGLQYDGGSWGSPTKVPVGVTGVGISYVNGQAVLRFPANTSQASTLWNAGSVPGPFNVIFGQPFPSGTGTFTNGISASQQFYFITTQ